MKKTALITGASSGIWLELAGIFASNGTNLLLVARNEAKLQEISKNLATKNGVEVYYLAKDLSNIDTAKEIFDYCQSNQIQIEYLINNAGFGDFGLFAESNWEKQLQMLNLNITSLTYLTHLFLPEMIARKSWKIMQVAFTATF